MFLCPYIAGFTFFAILLAKKADAYSANWRLLAPQNANNQPIIPQQQVQVVQQQQQFQALQQQNDSPASYPLQPPIQPQA